MSEPPQTLAEWSEYFRKQLTEEEKKWFLADARKSDRVKRPEADDRE